MTLQIKKIKQMIYKAYPNLAGDAKAYVDGLDSLITLFPDNIEDIRQQCDYIYLYLNPEPDNKLQELVKQRILDISQGGSSQDALRRHSENYALVEEEKVMVTTNVLDVESIPAQKFNKGEKINFMCVVVCFWDFY
jgi:hypothetical protein